MHWHVLYICWKKVFSYLLSGFLSWKQLEKSKLHKPNWTFYWSSHVDCLTETPSAPSAHHRVSVLKISRLSLEFSVSLEVSETPFKNPQLFLNPHFMGFNFLSTARVDPHCQLRSTFRYMHSSHGRQLTSSPEVADVMIVGSFMKTVNTYLFNYSSL